MLLWGSIVALEKMSGAEWSLGGDDRGDALLYLAAGLVSLQTSRLDPMAIPHCFARLISTSYSASCCNLLRIPLSLSAPGSPQHAWEGAIFSAVLLVPKLPHATTSKSGNIVRSAGPAPGCVQRLPPASAEARDRIRTHFALFLPRRYHSSLLSVSFVSP